MVKTLFLVDQQWREINPVQCGWEDCAPRHSYGPAVRSYYLLHYVLSGKGTFELHGKTHTLHAGQIFVIRPYERTYYEADAEEPWKYIWVGFETSLEMPEALRQDVLTAPEAQSIFSAMCGAEKMETGREAFLCGQIWMLLSLFRRMEKPTQKKSTDYVLQAVNRMQTYYMEHISIAELAAELNLDRSYFSTLFHKQTGKSPQQYLTELRLEKAAELMREHDYTPGEAALAVGYPDIFSFSRMFKRKYGTAPSRYAVQERET